MQKYWPVRHDLVMIDGIAMKGKRIIIPFILQGQIWSNYEGTIWA